MSSAVLICNLYFYKNFFLCTGLTSRPKESCRCFSLLTNCVVFVRALCCFCKLNCSNHSVTCLLLLAWQFLTSFWLVAKKVQFA
jgi:hypothetical protein